MFVWTGEGGAEETFESLLDGSKNATNQEMELQAAIEALRFTQSPRCPVAVRRFDRIVIYTDSQFLIDGAMSSSGWSRQGWTRRGGAPLVNTGQWRELWRLRKKSARPVIFEWRKGKSSKHTRRVDKLAKESANRPYKPAPTIRSLAPKTSDGEFEQGSLVPAGQVLEVQVLEAMMNRLQRQWRYKIEVLSDGPDLGKRDFLFHGKHLQRRNVYTVRLNKDPEFPQIDEVLGEEQRARRD